MPRFSLSLSSISEVKEFVDAANRCPCDVDVIAGRYLVNGKSIMGLFSVDLSQPVEVDVPDHAACAALRSALGQGAHT